MVRLFSLHNTVKVPIKKNAMIPNSPNVLALSVTMILMPLDQFARNSKFLITEDSYLIKFSFLIHKNRKLSIFIYLISRYIGTVLSYTEHFKSWSGCYKTECVVFQQYISCKYRHNWWQYKYSVQNGLLRKITSQNINWLVQNQCVKDRIRLWLCGSRPTTMGLSINTLLSVMSLVTKINHGEIQYQLNESE